MLMQFNFKEKCFAELNRVVDQNGNVSFQTNGENWIALETQDEIDKISESLTNGGSVWLEHGILKYTGKAPTSFHKWNGTEWILDEDKKAEFKRAMQETMRAKIVAKRDEMLNGGVFIPEFGKTVDTDATALSNYVQMKADFDLNGVDNEYVLIFSDFSFKAISFDEFKILWNAVKTHKERCYENATMHITLMLQADEPEKYDFSEFWQGEPHEKAK